MNHETRHAVLYSAARAVAALADEAAAAVFAARCCRASAHAEVAELFDSAARDAMRVTEALSATFTAVRVSVHLDDFESALGALYTSRCVAVRAAQDAGAATRAVETFRAKVEKSGAATDDVEDMIEDAMETMTDEEVRA